MKATFLFAAFFLTFMSGCASITTGTDQNIQITTPHCSDAICEVANSESVATVRTPGTVNINKSWSDATLTCWEKDNRENSISITKESSTTFKSGSALAGNIILGGIVGIAIDSATGASLEYPKQIDVPLECGAESKKASTVYTEKQLEGQHRSSARLLAEKTLCMGDMDLKRISTSGETYRASCGHNQYMLIQCDTDGECHVES